MVLVKKINASGSVSIYESGAGLPYAPIDWPNPGDIWSWRVGRRINSNGFNRDRYLIAPARFQKDPHRRLCFRSKKSIRRYLRSEYPGMDIDAFFDRFSWKVPARRSCSHEKAPNEPTKDEEAEINAAYNDCAMELNVNDGPRILAQPAQEITEEEAPTETPLEAAVRKIRELKRKDEEKRKAKLEADLKAARRASGAKEAVIEKPKNADYGPSGRSSRLVQETQFQFENTKDNPLVIDDDDNDEESEQRDKNLNLKGKDKLPVANPNTGSNVIGNALYSPPKISSLKVEGVTINAPTVNKNGNLVASTKRLIQEIEKTVLVLKKMKNKHLRRQ